MLIKKLVSKPMLTNHVSTFNFYKIKVAPPAPTNSSIHIPRAFAYFRHGVPKYILPIAIHLCIGDIKYPA